MSRRDSGETDTADKGSAETRLSRRTFAKTSVAAGTAAVTLLTCPKC